MRLVDCPNCFSSHSDEWDQSESVKEFATVSYYNTKSVPSKAAQQQQQQRRPSSKATNTFRQFAKVIFGKHHHHQQKNTIYGNPAGNAYKRFGTSTATTTVSALNPRTSTATFSRRKNTVERKHKIKKRDLVRKSRQKGIIGYFLFFSVYL